MSLATRLFIAVFAITFLVSGATGSYFYYQARDTIYQTLRQELRGAAASGATMISGDELLQLVSSEQADSRIYGEIQKVLGAIALGNPDFLYAYTMRMDGSTVRFVVDSPPSDDDGDGTISDDELPADIGEEYPDTTDQLLHGFIMSSVDVEPSCDEWGCYLSGYAPIRTVSGQSVGLLGIDMTVGRVDAKLNGIRVAGFVSLGIGGVLALALTLTFSRRIVRPVKELQKAFADVADGNYDISLVPHQRDEIGDLTSSFNGLVQELREKEVLKAGMGKVMGKDVLERLIGKQFQLGGEVVSATALFCDLRGFTALSELVPSSMLVGLLNEYFTAMVAIIEEYGGTVDKFVGDKIMAVFGHPCPLGNEQQAALDAARAMLKRCDALNDSLNLTGKFILENSIGLHSGMVLAGVIGSPDRMEYTIIGDSVNVAARLETLTRKLGIRLALSQDFVDHLEVDPSGLQSAGFQQLKGRKDALEVLTLNE